jgi:photosystem II stability/assembly factor-like uncharacterized protein
MHLIPHTLQTQIPRTNKKGEETMNLETQHKIAIKTLVILAFIVATIYAAIAPVLADTYTHIWTENQAIGATGYDTITNSDDGSYTTITGYNIGRVIYTSNDYGSSWYSAYANIWGTPAATMSGDGSRVVVSAAGGIVWTSTNYGVNFTEQAGAPSGGFWDDIECSADCQYIAAIYGPLESFGIGNVYTSNDYGVTWTQRSASGYLWRIDTSSDGSIIVVTQFGNVRKSTNYGSTWTSITPPTSMNFMGVAVSDNGQYIVLGASGGYIQTSSNGGTTWTGHPGVATGETRNVAISGDGSTMLAADAGGYIWRSIDYGSTWTQELKPGSRSWQDVTVSGDGLTLGAIARFSPPYIAEWGLCSPNWTCSAYDSCSINDTQTCTNVTDVNYCGETYTGDYSEFTPQACDYCTPNWSCDHYTNSSCLINDTIVGTCDSVSDSNNCYAQTGLPADQYSGDYSEFTQQGSCDYCTPSWSCDGYENETCLIDDTTVAACNSTTDSNSCYATTGLPTDQYNGTYTEFANQTGTCDYCTPAWNCTTYGEAICYPGDISYAACTAIVDPNTCYQITSLDDDNYTGNFSEFPPEEGICTYVETPVSSGGGGGSWPELSVAQIPENETAVTVVYLDTGDTWWDKLKAIASQLVQGQINITKIIDFIMEYPLAFATGLGLAALGLLRWLFRKKPKGKMRKKR